VAPDVSERHRQLSGHHGWRRTALSALLLPAVLAAQSGSIAGIVVDRANGQPLSGVHVRLYIGLMSDAAAQPYGAMSDAGGRFAIAALRPGTYTVELRRAGFVAVPGEGFLHHVEIVVHPGEQIAGRKLEMLPLVPIAGRVVNQYGDPVPGTGVRASADGASDRDFWQFSQGETDERGQFRLFLPPGKYYVAAGPLGSYGAIGPSEIRTDGTPDLAYATTYYPNAAGQATATAVEIDEGMEATGLEIRLRTTTERRNLTVSGAVTGAVEGGNVTVSYWWGESPGRDQLGGSIKADADGRFSFENLAAGYLRLLAQCSSPTADLESDVVEMRVQPPGVDNVRLALIPGGVVTGTIEIIGGDAALAAKLQIGLLPGQPGFMGAPTPAHAGGDGTFRIARVAPGKFAVHVDGLPDDGYIKTVLLDGVTTDGMLDFSPGVRGPKLRIIVGLDGGTISGELHGADGGPMLSAQPFVVLEPEPGKIGPSRPFVRIEGNRYLLKGIPPGKYRLFAADLAQMTPENRPAFLATAETVEIVEGARVTSDLKMQEAPIGKR